MNRSFNITEQERRRIIGMHTYATKTQHLNESYEYGIIQEGDELCDIICKRKMAAYGSNGDVVKEIQHALSKCGYNIKYEGGGMNTGCAKDKNSCDGKFRQHTRDAVKEFQKNNGLTVDGKVGYNTLKALEEEGCIDLPQCNCDDYDDNQEKYVEDEKTKQDYVNQFDCEEVKYCMQKYLFNSPVPDYPGFMECIMNNAKKGDDKIDNDYINKDGKVNQCYWNVGGKDVFKCPEFVNCMPGPGKDFKYCDSIAIKMCIKVGCTTKAV